MATENVNKDVNTENVVDLCVRSTKQAQTTAAPSQPALGDDLSEVLDLSVKHSPVSSSSSPSPKDHHLVSSTVASPKDKTYPKVSLPGACLATIPSKSATSGRKRSSDSSKDSPSKGSIARPDEKGSSKTVPNYKATHPIGSRKVTENVITYHEPMFQSVVNCLFERRQSEQQNLGKRKMGDKSPDEKSKKPDTISPEAKKCKLDSPSKPSMKKKVSIEHVVDRIRTQTKASSSTTQVNFSVKSPDKTVAMDLKLSNIKSEPVTEVAAESSTDSDRCEPSDVVDSKMFTKVITPPTKVVSKQSETPDSTSEGTEFPIKSEKKKPGPKSPIKDKSIAKVKKKLDKINSKDTKDKVKRPYKRKEKTFETVDGEKVLKMVKKMKTEFKEKEDGKKIKKKEIKTSKTDNKESTRTKENSKSKKGVKVKINKPVKKKILPVFAPRKKREASLNAAVLVNIMYEKSPPKSMTKRSKSESDLSAEPKQTIGVSHSCSELKIASHQSGSVKKDTKSTSASPKSISGNPLPKSALKRQTSNMEDDVFPKEKGDGINDSPSTTKKSSPKRKISFHDDVIKCSNINMKSPTSKGDKKEGTEIMKKNTKAENQTAGTSKFTQKDCKHKKAEPSIESKKNKKLVQVTSEEVAERKRKANLARLKKAKEIIRAKKLIKKKQSNGSCSSLSESDSSVSDSTNKDSDEQNDSEAKKNRTKKGALQRAARTHVSVEQKNVYENVSTSPKWCDCCQSTYSYPSQTQSGTKLWGLRELVDRGSSNPPTQIQSSSQHVVAANSSGSCEVRPYGSPSHVPMMDSASFVGQLMPHSHMGCSPCACGHSGMLHTTQCQNYPIGGVGNLLSCQHYSNSYSVPYPHSSYAHCGCASTYHHPGSHGGGQPLLSNITTETPILVHRPVQLQVSHDSSHAVSLPGPMQITHTVSDSGLSHSQISCNVLQGEITNVTRSNSFSDQEFIDVGGDDIRHSGSTSSVNTKFSPESNSIPSSVKMKDLPATKQVYVKVKKCSIGVKKEKSTKFDLKVKMKKNLNVIKKKGGKSINSKDTDSSMTVVTDKVKKKILDKTKASKPNVKLSKVKFNDELVKRRKTAEEKRKEINKKLKKEAKMKKEIAKSVKQVIVEENDSMEDKKTSHGWSWYGDGIMKKVTNIFDGQLIERKCYNGIQHEDGDVISVKDCILVCSGKKRRDLPYVAKVGNFFEDPTNGEMMMTILWYYRPEHTDGGRKPGQLEKEVFAAKHRDETLVACIEDKGYVLTYNEFCRFTAEVERHKGYLPPRKRVVPDSEEDYPRGRIPPVDIDPENVFLCRQVYDIKLKRVLKNPV